MAKNEANLPPDEKIDGTDIELPYYFLADGSFSLSRRIITPFARVPQIPLSERKFNKRLSSARQLIECSFGILANKWKILQKPMNFKLKTTETIVMALIYLHNFILTNELETSVIGSSYTTISNTAGQETATLDGFQLDNEDLPEAGGLEVRRLLT